MSKPPFTPGPWVARASTGRQPADVQGRDGGFVGDFGNHDHADANAHLAAAAPDLYAACEAVEDLIDSVVTELARDGFTDEAVDAQANLEALRAALAKARGES